MTRTFPFYLLRHYIFWLVVFFVDRLVFIVYNLNKLEGISFSELFQTFTHGIYLDNSAIAYVLGIPLIVIFLQSFFRSQSIFSKILQAYTFFLLLVDAMITAAELPLFDDWGTKLNYKAISYLTHPSEVINTTPVGSILLVLLLVVLKVGIFFWIYKKFVIQKRIEPLPWRWLTHFVAFLFLLFLLVLSLRGGLQPIAINQSDVYFSKHDIVNTTAVNSAWNLFFSIDKNAEYMDENPYRYYDPKSAEAVVQELFTPRKDTTVKILSTNRPNVVMIILESWPADCVYGIDGYFKGITPFFDSLASDGILFTDCYGSGYRSDQGMVAIFSGFPAQPKTSIIKQSDKIRKLPCINTSFKKMGYHTSFLFGGQLSYGNIKSYMYYNQFDDIAEEADFPAETPRGRLGIHDENLFERLHADINSYQAPFFAATFTCSSHSPYDYPPLQNPINFGGDEMKHYNAVKYTDQCLKKFFEDVKKEPWYRNTLFVLLSDHGHGTSKKWPRKSAAYKKIAMLFYGDVIKNEFRGVPYTQVSGQVDLSKTLLNQLGMNADAFHWSSDLFNPYRKEFAFHSFEDGVGWVTPEGVYGYDHFLHQITENTFVKGSKEFKAVEKEAKSYLQVLFEEYMQY